MATQKYLVCTRFLHGKRFLEAIHEPDRPTVVARAGSDDNVLWGVHPRKLCKLGAKMWVAPSYFNPQVLDLSAQRFQAIVYRFFIINQYKHVINYTY